MTSPIGMPGGNSEASPWARHPEVTTVWPIATRFEESMKSRTRSSGLPTDGLITPWTPRGRTLAETALAWSVTSVTCEELGCTAETRRPGRRR